MANGKARHETRQKCSFYQVDIMKTALITERIDSKFGGAERSVQELHGSLRELGVEVVTVTAAGKSDRSDVINLCSDNPSAKFYPFNFAEKLEDYLSKNDFDIIHSALPFDFADIYQPRGGSYSEAMVRNCESYRHQFTVAFKRFTSRLNKKRSRYISMEKELCQNSDTVIAAISGYVADCFRKYYGTAEERLEIIPNGIAVPLKADEKRLKKIRQELTYKLGKKTDKDIVLFLFGAHNFRLKGLRNLIESLSRLKQESRCNWGLVAAGSGKAGPYKQFAKQLGIESHVVFTGATENIAELISACDAAVLPSYYDPCSRFILEGLALGKPVITTRYNGASERYKNGIHGLVIDSPEDVEALKAGLEYFLDREKLNKASEEIIKDGLVNDVCIKKHAEKVLKLYEKILKKKEQSK